MFDLDNLEFELHKVKREIQRHGEYYTFYRKLKNEFGEPVGEEVEVKVLKGLYHEEIGFIKFSTDEGANIKKKPESQILCIIKYEEEGEEPDDSEDGETINSILKVFPDVTDSDVKVPSEESLGFHTEIAQGDYVKVGNSTYYVIGITDIQNYGIIGNISLDKVV